MTWLDLGVSVLFTPIPVMGHLGGTLITFLVENDSDQRPKDYQTDLYLQPCHADYTDLLKYDVKASSGGSHTSARETIKFHLTRTHLFSANGDPSLGAIAERYLKQIHGVEIVGKIHLPTKRAPHLP